MKTTITKMEKIKILLVEDAYINQILIDNILSEIGYEVIIAGNGLQALKEIEKSKPNLLILDLMMPIMDGFTFLKKVKKPFDFPILAVTARNDYESIEKAIKLGVSDYLIKPFNSNDLANKIERLLMKE